MDGQTRIGLERDVSLNWRQSMARKLALEIWSESFLVENYRTARLPRITNQKSESMGSGKTILVSENMMFVLRLEKCLWNSWQYVCGAREASGTPVSGGGPPDRIMLGGDTSWRYQNMRIWGYFLKISEYEDMRIWYFLKISEYEDMSWGYIRIWGSQE